VTALVRQAHQASGRKSRLARLRSQRGSVYLECALLGFACIIAGAVLVRFHRAFALLLPIGLVVFFLPNLMALAERLRIRRRLRRELAAARERGRDGVIVLKNRLRGFDAQALWLHTRAREIGFIAADEQTRIVTWEAVQRVQAVFVEESSAMSFHKGKIRIPPRYLLAFSCADGFSFEFVTLRRRVMTDWIEALRPHLGERLKVDFPADDFSRRR
jgi:hypothetical protein